MELVKLILKNFRLHKDLKLEFKTGITGIIGTNGRGKSSIVEAILFLLTGEGYGTKADMLTVGQVSGYVIGHFLINGKEAILERHLDTAKVNFKYNGTTYKKSSEVTEIWNQLFQIDKHIVKSIVIANQGDIAMLFNSDASVKEKLFQKIFMVPNTTKIRDIVWTNYIKNAPPEYPVKDGGKLLSDIQVLEHLISLKEEELRSLTIDEDRYKELIARQAYLNSCKLSTAKAKQLHSAVPILEGRLNRYNQEREALDEKLKLIDIAHYREQADVIKIAKEKFEQAQKLEEQISELELAPEFTSSLCEQLKNVQQKLIKNSADISLQNERISKLRADIEKYNAINKTEGVCPTCGTKLEDVSVLISRTEEDIADHEQKIAILEESLPSLKAEETQLLLVKEKYEQYVKRRTNLESQLDLVKHHNYVADDDKLCTDVLQAYDRMMGELQVLTDSIAATSIELSANKALLAGTIVYDYKYDNIDAELPIVGQEISNIESCRDKVKSCEVELGKDRNELENLRKDLRENTEYERKNQKRKAYLDVLHGIYDILHSSKFPRLLIQTYASTVAEYMNEVLETFDFPYSTKVNDNFGIDVYNTEGKLPSVSGGQQIMIGFSLRLALHNMFGESFPFMIIDEGSYGLATEARQKYFQILANLNKLNKFKQIIVIDHNDELDQYIDNTIKL